MLLVKFRPKQSRRDGKLVPERLPSNTNLDIRNHTDQDQNHRRRLQDGLPLDSLSTPDAKLDSGTVSKEPDRKPNGHQEGTKHSSNPTEAQRSRSYFQVLLKIYESDHVALLAN